MFTYLSVRAHSVTVEGPTAPYETGQTISFTCSIIGGNPAPTKSWYKGSDLLAGETGDSLLLPLSVADNGKDVVCKATNSAGEKTNAMTLLIYSRY